MNFVAQHYISPRSPNGRTVHSLRAARVGKGRNEKTIGGSKFEYALKVREGHPKDTLRVFREQSPVFPLLTTLLVIKRLNVTVFLPIVSVQYTSN